MASCQSSTSLSAVTQNKQKYYYYYYYYYYMATTTWIPQTVTNTSEHIRFVLYSFFLFSTF